MTDSLVETVARAIFETTPYASVRWETVSGDELGETMRKAARAAIAALPSPEREPMREALGYLESEARRFAGFYPEASDGRNTFVIFADKIAALAPPTAQSGDRA